VVLALVDLGRFFSFLIYTQSVGLLGREMSQSQGRYLHTEQNKHRINAQTCMPRVEFELTIPAFEREKTVHAFDRAATVIDSNCIMKRLTTVARISEDPAVETPSCLCKFQFSFSSWRVSV
jgi:hypothetical protein